MASPIEQMMAKMPKGPEMDPEEADEGAGLESCMADFAAAMKVDDAAGMAAAFKDALDVYEAKPHKEAPTEE